MMVTVVIKKKGGGESIRDGEGKDILWSTSVMEMMVPTYISIAPTFPVYSYNMPLQGPAT